MAKDVIVLDIGANQGGFTTVRCCFWLTISNPIAIPNAVSQWQGASASENAALASGAVREEVYSFQFPTGTSKATIENNLLALFTARQTWVTAQVSPGQFYGTFHDSSTGWSA